MSKTNSTNPLLLASSIKKLEDLCDWIENNSDSSIGWDDLTKQSGFSHNELINIFRLYKQIKPMAYIRKVRENKKNLLSNNPQSQLFADILNKKVE
jgi:transcriptional regulator GlxA family with amidase domain